MATAPLPDRLSRRERQILHALYAIGEGGAREVVAQMREPDALDSVRVTLAGLERKGAVSRRRDGRRHVYTPAQPVERAGRSAWQQLTRVFFGNSPGRALLTMLDQSGDRLSDDELDALEQWVRQQSRTRGRRGG